MFEVRSPTEDSLYTLTRARFVQNEAHRMARHRVQYDVHALARVAAAAAGSQECIHAELLPGGMLNKVLLLTMDDGKEVIAKVPFPVAGLQHFTTASEVATVDWLRRSTETPIPKVLAWCSRAETTPVGAEYIIMEKAFGVPLKAKWSQLKLQKRFEVAETIARFQKQWSSASLFGYGSIYYASDLSEQQSIPLGHGVEDTHDTFVLGPTTGRDWLDEERQTLDIDRGPWRSVEDYLEAIGKREMTSIKDLPMLPPSPITLCGPGTYTSTRAKKLRAVSFYTQVCKHVAPCDPGIRKPAICHQDLHMENVLVDPDMPTRITSIIDWQSTEVAPLFVLAQMPVILEHDGPRVAGLERPRLPSNLNQFEPCKQDRSKTLAPDQDVCMAYQTWTRANNPDFWKALEFQKTDAFEVLRWARALLVDGEAIYAARVLELLESGDADLKNCDLQISAEVAAEIRSDSASAVEGMKAMLMIQDIIGDLFPERGLVRAEIYHEAKNALAKCKEQIMDLYAHCEADRAAWHAAWPFDNE